MKNWEQFQIAQPTLLRIEKSYDRLVQFLQKYEPADSQIHGLSEEDIEDAKDAMLQTIREDALQVHGKVYYWLYPFYSGNFFRLVAALGTINLMGKQEDNEETRTAFYRFFRTVPMEERLKLGDRLNQPELTEKAIRIQEKISARKAQIKIQLDKFNSN